MCEQSFSAQICTLSSCYTFLLMTAVGCILFNAHHELLYGSILSMLLDDVLKQIEQGMPDPQKP